MSLFSSIRLAANSLTAAQIGLQVVGQNIANVNTPGYIREEVVLTPQATQKQGDLLLGLGVDITAIVQKIDLFLEERLRGAISDRSSAETQEQTYLQLEGLVGELSDTDLSTSLNNFFNSISEVLNQPESVSVRNLAVLQGSTLTSDINRLSSRVRDVSTDVNKRIIDIAQDINRLTEEIRELNVQITSVEGGRSSASDAVGLRDQRNLALSKLSELIDIQTEEQVNGSVAVFVAGDFLVLEGVRREVFVNQTSEGGVPTAEVLIQQTNSPLRVEGGELSGLIESRDVILGGFIDELDSFASTLAFEFNRVFSSVQGLTGYHEATAEFAVDDTSLVLDDAGLSFTPVNGSFEVLVLNKQTGLTKTTSIRVDLNGLDDDTTMDDLVAQLDAINGITATVDATGHLSIASDSVDSDFSFANDTSGLLAALGINTFFSGSSALNLGVNEVLLDDPAKFAASGGGIGEDTANAVELAAFIDRPLDTANGSTMAVLYDRLVGQVTQGSTVTTSIAEGFRVFEDTLEGQQLATSGVSLDEEAVRMLAFQQAYQASARYIATLSELMDILVSL